MSIKTERLKKMESEMRDLQQWLKLGLVPKKDLAKHEEEIKNLQSRIEEENERIKFLKEGGDLEDLYTSRKTPSRNVYQDAPTISDIHISDTAAGVADTSASVDNDSATDSDEPEKASEEGNETAETEWEDPFSDAARWRRGISDPDAEEW
jgi:hypothetical protein